VAARRHQPLENDHITAVWSRKDEDPQQWTEALALGYAIIDASFCSPAKASRCLLNCQEILLHLQHHVNIQVCSQSLCSAVEFHFSHLSRCERARQESSCEYCLRTREREGRRIVELTESEQPELESKIKSTLNAIMHSLANDPPQEREQTIIQLEDELEQAEENKRELTTKLRQARSQLRQVQRQISALPFGQNSLISGNTMPQHFVKSQASSRSSSSSSSGSSSKRQRTMQ
jgi:hypothetical protein